VYDVVRVAKYKTLEKLLSSTELPALVEQKPRPSSAAKLDVFDPLTLTETFQQTFLVVNFINDGQSFVFTSLRHALDPFATLAPLALSALYSAAVATAVVAVTSLQL